MGMVSFSFTVGTSLEGRPLLLGPPSARGFPGHGLFCQGGHSASDILTRLRAVW